MPVAALGIVAAMMILDLAITTIKYGTLIADATGGPAEAFQSFLITSATGGFVICVVFGMVSIGGIAYFGRRNKLFVVLVGLVGLATAVGGVFSQFYSATAPVGDALWGRHLALAILAVVAVWTLVNVLTRPAPVDAVGRYRQIHGEVGRSGTIVEAGVPIV